MARDDWEQAAARLGLAYEAGGPIKKPCLSGTLNGLPVKVAYTVEDYGHTTLYTVSFPPLGLGLRLHRASPARRLSRRLSGGAPAAIAGNPSFDRVAAVKGEDPEALARFLDAERQAAVLRVFEQCPGARISDDRITWQSNRVDRADRLEATVHTLVDCALSLVR